MTASAVEAAEPRPTMTVAEVAELLGVSEWLVLKQVQQGNLPHKRFGRRIIISRARLIAWIDEAGAAV
ncbi:MAG: hypothetical protein NVS3B26_13830 [Mycobacteriales bacterium]